MLPIGRSNESNLLDSILKEARVEKKAMEFPTQEAMDKYLKQHPDADKSNHKVIKKKKEESKPEEDKSDLKKKVEEKKKELTKQKPLGDGPVKGTKSTDTSTIEEAYKNSGETGAFNPEMGTNESKKQFFDSSREMYDDGREGGMSDEDLIEEMSEDIMYTSTPIHDKEITKELLTKCNHFRHIVVNSKDKEKIGFPANQLDSPDEDMSNGVIVGSVDGKTWVPVLTFPF